MPISTDTLVQVYDPPMCCPTGVCGPSVDAVLPRFAADLQALQGQGIKVERYNLSQEPGAFVENELVRTTLHAEGSDCLPLILVDGRVVSRGQYPASREQFLAVLNGEASPTVEAEAGCCGEDEEEDEATAACDPQAGCC